MFPWRGRGGGGGFRGGGNFQHPRFGGPQGNFDGGMMGFGGYGGPGQGMNQGQGMFGGPRFGNRGRGGPRFNRSNNRENVEKFKNNANKRNESKESISNIVKTDPEPTAGPSHGNIQVKVEDDVKGKKAVGSRFEDEPEYDDSLCILDWYNSDLNLSITPSDFCSVTAMSRAGFGYMWAGVRATHGGTRGRVCFEVRIDSNQPTDHLQNETTPNVLRCGWSTCSSDLQLGEVKHSFGYGGTGKISENCKFKNYGKKFGVGDVIGCYLDLNCDPIIMKFTVNGVDQGVAFRLNRSELGDQALFPHVLTKNQDFTINFGQLPGPMFPLLKGFTPIGQLDSPDGIKRGFSRPQSREECEVLMMIGLPGAGKTHWAEKYKAEHPEKNYNILGTNNLIDKMKVEGLSRKRNYNGRWEELIKQCTECFNKLLDLAAKRRRNYILDQTNVFPTARGRKLKPFTGFQCKAVVVVPNDQEFRRRVQTREAVEGKEVPDAAVLNMKANFVLPDIEETFFSAVYYTELPPEETQNIVTQYNAEAISIGQPPSNAVSSFKTRNAQKRNELGAKIPGEILDQSVDSKQELTPNRRQLPEPSKIELKREEIKEEEVKEEKVEAGPSDEIEIVKEKIEKRRSRSVDSFGRVKRSRSKSIEKARKKNKSKSRSKSRDRRRSRSRNRNIRRRSRSRSRDKNKDLKRKSRSRSRDRNRERRRSRSRSRGRNDSRRRDDNNRRDNQDLKWQNQPSPWLSGAPGTSPFSSKNKNDDVGGQNRSQSMGQMIMSGQGPSNMGPMMGQGPLNIGPMMGQGTHNMGPMMGQTSSNLGPVMGGPPSGVGPMLGQGPLPMIAGFNLPNLAGMNEKDFTALLAANPNIAASIMSSGILPMGGGGLNPLVLPGNLPVIPNLSLINPGPTLPPAGAIQGPSNVPGVTPLMDSQDGPRKSLLGSPPKGSNSSDNARHRREESLYNKAQSGGVNQSQNQNFQGGQSSSSQGSSKTANVDFSKPPPGFSNPPPFMSQNSSEQNQQSGNQSSFGNRNQQFGHQNQFNKGQEKHGNQDQSEENRYPPFRSQNKPFENISFKHQDSSFGNRSQPFNNQSSSFGNRNQNRPFENQNNSFENHSGSRNQVIGNQPQTFGDKNQQFGNQGQQNRFGNRNQQFGGQRNSIGNRNQQFGDQNSSIGNRNQQFGDQNSSFGNRNDIFGEQNNSFRDKNKQFGEQNSSFGNRNLSNFGIQNKQPGNKDNNFENKNQHYGDQGNLFGNRNQQFHDQGNSFGTRNQQFGDQRNPFGNRNQQYGDQGNSFENRNQQFGEQGNSFGNRNLQFGDQGNSFGNRDQQLCDQGNSFQNINKQFCDQGNTFGNRNQQFGDQKNYFVNRNDDSGDQRSNFQNRNSGGQGFQQRNDWNERNLPFDSSFGDNNDSFETQPETQEIFQRRNSNSSQSFNKQNSFGESWYSKSSEQASASATSTSRSNDSHTFNRDSKNQSSRSDERRGRFQEDMDRNNFNLDDRRSDNRDRSTGNRRGVQNEDDDDNRRRRDDDRSRRRSPEGSRRSVEVVKSAGDRRMERELRSAIVKNPFDPSNRIGKPRNRLDEEDFDQPCMNPEAPDPPPEERPGGSGDNKSSAGGGGGAPDYAALLQYLQFYQKQMEETKK